MDYIYKKLKELEPVAGMFLGRQSLVRLSNYIGGYLDRQHEIDASVESCVVFFPEFQEFLENYYGIGDKTTQGWVEIITGHCDDDSTAFRKFYELLDEYLESKGVSTEQLFKECRIEPFKKLHMTDESIVTFCVNRGIDPCRYVNGLNP